MAHKSFEVEINPDVLKWARESSGISIEDVAKRFGRSADFIEKWEDGGKKPTIKILEDLASFYKRPLAALFLPEPPKEPSLPNDFRLFRDTTKTTLASKSRIAIRRARRLRDLAMELSEDLSKEISHHINKVNLSSNPEEVAMSERRRLEAAIEEQLKWKSPYEAFNKWRALIEKNSILVFQMKMPLEDARGFSLNDNGIPTIVINSSDSIHARIFTLFHEYAHILIGETGICIPDEHLHKKTQSNKEEWFSNYFAGAFLVPKDAILQESDIRGIEPESDEFDKSIVRISNNFKVSKYVILRRLQINNLISYRTCKYKLDQWELSAKSQISGKRSGRGKTATQKCLDEKGKTFISLVLNAQKGGIITTNDVIDYLSVPVKNLDELKQSINK